MATIVDAPFAYEVEVVRKGKRSKETLTIWDLAPVPVEEIAVRDAPVAISAELGLEGKVDYRYAEGALWRPIRAVDGGGAGGKAADVAGRAFDRNRFVPRDSKLLDTNPKTKPTPKADLAVKETIRSGRQEGLVTLQKHVDGLRVIGGQLYERSAGPVLWLVPADKNEKAFSVVVGDAHDTVAGYSPALVFRADDLDGVRSYLASLIKKPEPIEVAEPKFLIDGVYDFDEAKHAVVESARMLFGKATDEITIGSLPGHYLEGWCQYRRMADRNEASPELSGWVILASESLKGSKITHLARIGSHLKGRFGDVPAPTTTPAP